jgi:hypothetical protein
VLGVMFTRYPLRRQSGEYLDVEVGGIHNNHRVLHGSKIWRVGLKSVPTCHGRAEESLQMYSHGAVNGCCQVTRGAFMQHQQRMLRNCLGEERGGEGWDAGNTVNSHKN